VDQVLVSIVVETFNAKKYIGKAIESVTSQTYENWELVTVDDASADNIFDIASSYNDQRVKVLKSTQNVGPGPSRNTGMKIATVNG